MAMASPQDVRAAIASGRYGANPTSGCCQGYLQANLVILPAAHADDFEAFCRANCRSCPLLYRSSPGQTNAPPLAQSSDVRREVPAYNVYRHGQPMETRTDITDLWADDMVAFYTGCSFSFETALAAAGLPAPNVLQGKNVAMYRTNRACTAVGAFHADLVVSMRPYPADQVARVRAITEPSVLAHGGPVHCGAPQALGIASLAQPDYGDPIEVPEGHVPCFWACGVTSGLAVANAGLPLVITHRPGSMFITDIVEAEAAQALTLAGLCGFSARAMASINALETLVQRDPGQRGIASLACPTELWHSALKLDTAASVLITTGFPCIQGSPPTESDGPLGTVMLARALVLASKRVVVLVDAQDEAVVRAALQAAYGLCPAMAAACQLHALPATTSGEEVEALLSAYNLDALVAIERTGRAEDGHYYTMRGRIMKDIAPIDDLFLAANARGITTIGVGDGGNELGMGKVKGLVHHGIPRGDVIACATAAQHLIAAGVSNWGGDALCAALAVLARDRGHDDLAAALLPDESFEEEVLSAMFAAGCKDGVRPDQPMSVDGMPFAADHCALLRELRALVQ